jgi:hypothetical protein
MRSKPTTKFLVGAGILLLLLASGASAQSGGTTDPSTQALLRRLSRRVARVEAQNRELATENRQLQSAMSKSQQQILELQSQVRATSRAVPALQAGIPAMKQQVVRTKAEIDAFKSDRTAPGTAIGFRQGWSETPFDLPGGIYYGAYISHILVSREDGIPGGDLTGALEAGAVLGGGKNIQVTTALLGTRNVSLSEDLVSIQPTLQYHLRIFEPFEPYVLGGPSIFVSIPQSSGLIAGQVPLPPEIRQYGIRSGVTSAEFYAGAVGGLGVQYRLSGLRVPAIQSILDKITVGAEWRYKYMDDGEQFQQYTGSLALGF